MAELWNDAGSTQLEKHNPSAFPPWKTRNSPLRTKELLGIPCPWNGMTPKVLPNEAFHEISRRSGREFPRGMLAQHPYPCLQSSSRGSVSFLISMDPTHPAGIPGDERSPGWGLGCEGAFNPFFMEREKKGKGWKIPVAIAMEMGMAGETPEQRENPIPAIFCQIFF